MSAVLQEAGTQLTVQARASLALGAAEHEKKLLVLAQQSKDITAITNAVGYQQCHGSRMALKNERINLEKLGKSARDDATKFSKAVIAEEQRLIGLIEPEEKRLQEIQDAHDAKVEAEKQAKREAEQNRIAKIQAAIADLKDFAINAAYQTAAQLAELMDLLEQQPIDERFGEFKPDAEQVKVATMNRLNAMRAQAVDKEAAAAAEAERLATEQARIKAESEELARRQTEQAERERAEAARIAQEAQERAQAEASAKAAIEAEEAAARQRIEATEAESRRRREEADRKATEAREAAEAQARAEFEAQQAALKVEADRLAKERLAAEERERKKQEAIEAKEKAKREKAEAAERAERLKEQERMDTLQMAEAFLARIERREEWAASAKAIEADLAAQQVSP